MEEDKNKDVRGDFQAFMFLTTGSDGKFYILSINDQKQMYLAPKSGNPDFSTTMIFWSSDAVQVNTWLQELKEYTGSTLEIDVEDLLPVSVTVSHSRKAIDVN